MKKMIAIILTLGMALCIPGSAFAAETSAENKTETVPVLGYIGPDAYTIPTDPETPSEFEIYVEIPVQIMFAAFECDAGDVTSPRFAITNLSEKNDVRVEVERFDKLDNPDIDLDGMLSLTLVDSDGEPLIADLFPSDYSVGKVLAESLAAYVEGSDDNRLEFTVGGTWSGTFDDELHPAFDMTIKLSAVL